MAETCSEESSWRGSHLYFVGLWYKCHCKVVLGRRSRCVGVIRLSTFFPTYMRDGICLINGARKEIFLELTCKKDDEGFWLARNPRSELVGRNKSCRSSAGPSRRCMG